MLMLGLQMGPGNLMQLLVNFITAGIPFLRVKNLFFARFVEIVVSLAPGCIPTPMPYEVHD